jgi:N-carbamoyl-L-amino-acid hydrolase
MINRREFGAALAAGLGTMVLAPRKAFAGATARWTGPVVNGQRVNDRLTHLSQFGRNPQGGVTRLAYSDADKLARASVVDWMRAAQLNPTIDFAGNIIGRRAGRDASLRPLVFGSHVDSVPEGGNYDGNLGSVAAIEVAQVLLESGTTLRHPIEIAVWANEEGGLYGSRAVSGQLSSAELKNTSRSGKTIEEGIAFIGGDPARLDRVKRAKGDIAGYFELHIEQGGLLEATNTKVGIVEGIVGIQQWEVTVDGFANHAGTTAMDQRHDALLSAARFVEMVNRVVRAEPGRQVGTVGKMQAFPGAPNVVPGQVICTLELRDLDDEKVTKLYEKIVAEAKKIGAANGTTFAYKGLHANRAAPTDPKMRALIGTTAQQFGFSTRAMPSGAGHDAQAMAQLGPAGMIFIPSIGGISHSPKEFSTPADCVNGANVLLGSVLAFDG